MAIDRRHFLKVLGGVVTAMAAKPVLTLVPPETRVGYVDLKPVLARYLSLDEINAVALAIHAEAFPEHRDHYRARALQVIGRIRSRAA